MPWRLFSTLAFEEKVTRFSASQIANFFRSGNGYVKDVDIERRIVSLCLSLEIEPEAAQALKDWTSREGNVLSPGIASGVCSWLIHRRQNVQALKLMRLMREEKMIEMTPRHYKEEISLTCSQCGSSKAEALFNVVPPCMRTEDVQTAFLCALAKECSLAKVEKWINELQLISPLAWNAVLNMFLKRDKHEKVRRTYYRFKSLGVQPDIHTYLVALRCREATGGFEQVDAEAKAAVSQVDIHQAEARLLNTLIMTYAYLGNKEMVSKLWEVLRSGPQPLDQDSYVNWVKSFGICLDVDKALEVAEELVSKHSHLYENPYTWIVETYVKLEMMDKAERTLKQHFPKPSFAPYNFLVTGYLDRQEPWRALEKLQEGYNAVPLKDIRFFYRTVMKLMPLFAERRDVQAAEKVMAGYSGQGDIAVYNELLKVYVEGSMMPNRFMERLQEQRIEPDGETERLLESLRTSSNRHMKVYKHGSGWVDNERNRRVTPYSFTEKQSQTQTQARFSRAGKYKLAYK